MTPMPGPARDLPASDPARTWAAFERAAPDLARFARERLEAHRHRTIATIRADGSPRISGTELTIAFGELWVGGLAASRKFADMRRDPRVAIHSGTDDPPPFPGDARVSGLAIFVEDEATKAALLEAAGGGPPGPFELVRIELREVSTVQEAPTRDHLVIELWRPGEAVRRVERW
jgi:hypothetical protein